MKGHVQTPSEIADRIVSELFDTYPPEGDDTILFPGVGDGPFVWAVERYCEDHGCELPAGVAIDLNPELVATARDSAGEWVDFYQRDLLEVTPQDYGTFDYVVGNPPYVPIEELDAEEKRQYKNEFETAEQRFDLYILFIEQSLRLLKKDGRVVFITPEKFEYTHTTGTLRKLLSEYHVERIEHVSEDTFDGYVTYPTITTIHDRDATETQVIRRDGTRDIVELPRDGSSWAPHIRSADTGAYGYDSGVTLDDVTVRVSCGLATGRDSIFVRNEAEVPEQLVDEGWTYPTTSGRQLTVNDGPDSDDVIICPYDERGELVPEDGLGTYGDWAKLHREELESRSCVKNGKVWYAWHENPPMDDLYGTEKILCKDVCESPQFCAERSGEVVPRHSVYYIIPQESVDLNGLLEYLNSPKARAWLEANAQKAHNDYYRMQSKVLKKLPVPEEMSKTKQTTLV